MQHHVSVQHREPDVPRILCLHGGGTNARIFRRQCRALIRALASHYRLVFAEAPWLSDSPGPDVQSVYQHYGPFKRWLPAHLTDPWVDPSTAISAIDTALRRAIHFDDDAGYQSPWVGLLGFSQGAKLAASILLETERRGAFAGVSWQFGLLFAGRAPLVALHEDSFDDDPLCLPNEIAPIARPGESRELAARDRVSLPTVHVHGLSDPHVECHRVLFEDYSVRGTAARVEWRGPHRIPIRDADISAVVQALLQIVRPCRRIFLDAGLNKLINLTAVQEILTPEDPETSADCKLRVKQRR